MTVKGQALEKFQTAKNLIFNGTFPATYAMQVVTVVQWVDVAIKQLTEEIEEDKKKKLQ